ncbi:MAG: helix-turn-helix domain-containing protein [Chitinophagales bacterium]|nr:helix-turn-helix domain-containing protein [Chitinophagales bacterium]MCZ2393254.1 helix-turn-helix domain-containing protein [Chitinophagales bacterium]
MISTKDIRKKIASIRERKGYSQDFVANRLGLTQSAYSLIESGSRDLKVNRLLQIAIVLEVNVIEFFEDDDINNSKKSDVNVQLTIELKKEKKDQVLKLIFGDNNLEIINK